MIYGNSLDVNFKFTASFRSEKDMCLLILDILSFLFHLTIYTLYYSYSWHGIFDDDWRIIWKEVVVDKLSETVKNFSPLCLHQI
jgi:hypothetical protein